MIFAKSLLAGFLTVLALSTTANAQAQKMMKPAGLKDSTGVCFRRLTWTNAKGELDSRYEFILAKQSSSIAKDMQRLQAFESKGSMARSPDMISFTWLHAWLSDNSVDATHGPDCSKLPAIHDH